MILGGGVEHRTRNAKVAYGHADYMQGPHDVAKLVACDTSLGAGIKPGPPLLQVPNGTEMEKK